MKKLGKVAGTATAAIAFTAVAQQVNAMKPAEDNLTFNCAVCDGGCHISCMSSCTAFNANNRSW
ncbi:MAG: hypothetical protein Q4C70_10325 [Planctomycetia bacterium]|nr:hypothetical protein [Planctomycetia bacterium]